MMLGAYEREAQRIAQMDADVEGKVAEIVASVSNRTGVPEGAILGDSRRRKVAHARQLAMWRAYREGLSLPEIGRAMNRDHTTIMHGVHAVDQRMKETANDE